MDCDRGFQHWLPLDQGPITNNLTFITFNLIFFFRYSEIWNYSFETTKSINGKAVGHFTQVVWQDSTHLGVGIATMPARKYAEYGNQETFVVAMYSPAGNYKGRYHDKVKARKDGCIDEQCKWLKFWFNFMGFFMVWW